MYLAPALAAIAYETDKPDAPGLDYAGLQIGHLGAIYEALLTLRLNPRSRRPGLRRQAGRVPPLRAGEQPEVTKAQLYYQAEAGGRKAGGVFYTRHEFVDHLAQPLSVASPRQPPRRGHEVGGAATRAKQPDDCSTSRLWILQWAVPTS